MVVDRFVLSVSITSEKLTLTACVFELIDVYYVPNDLITQALLGRKKIHTMLSYSIFGVVRQPILINGLFSTISNLTII